MRALTKYRRRPPSGGPPGAVPLLQTKSFKKAAGDHRRRRHGARNLETVRIDADRVCNEKANSNGGHDDDEPQAAGRIGRSGGPGQRKAMIDVHLVPLAPGSAPRAIYVFSFGPGCAWNLTHQGGHVNGRDRFHGRSIRLLPPTSRAKAKTHREELMMQRRAVNCSPLILVPRWNVDPAHASRLP